MESSQFDCASGVLGFIIAFAIMFIFALGWSAGAEEEKKSKK